ncbi:MAG: hypothetical protein QM784_15790 [Polyangiaceae bacterium]
MRRSAVLIPVPLAYSGAAWGQTVVEDSAASEAEQTSPANPIPSPSERQAPSVADPKATYVVEPAPVEPPLRLKLGSPDRDRRTGHCMLGALAAYGTTLGNFTSRDPIGSRFGDTFVPWRRFSDWD